MDKRKVGCSVGVDLHSTSKTNDSDSSKVGRTPALYFLFLHSHDFSTKTSVQCLYRICNLAAASMSPNYIYGLAPTVRG